MTIRSQLMKIAAQEDINFLLTNRIPRRLATQFIGWFSKIEQPLVRDLSIAIWRMFSDLNLSEAKSTRFKSMHDCFVRELKDGARPIDGDPRFLVSPCDAIVGASGTIAGTELLQVKGFPYTLQDLFGDEDFIRTYRNGQYVTLRLTSTMYHRFHAPHDCTVEQVKYLSGDTWNVNPIALKRIEKLFCKNERAMVRTKLNGSCRHAGPGRGDPGGKHPAALSRRRCGAESARGDAGQQGIISKRRGDGLVPARLDHHRVSAGRLCVMRRCARGSEHPHRTAADETPLKPSRRAGAIDTLKAARAIECMKPTP